MKSTTNILRTKLHRPAVPAPAGYGKSTLVSSWLETGAFPSAWVSLDGEENDPRQFLSYFLAAVETLFPDVVRHTRALVDAATLPSLPQLAASLINDLDGIHQGFVLVLDDTHRIREHPVYDLLTELLPHLTSKRQDGATGRRGDLETKRKIKTSPIDRLRSPSAPVLIGSIYLGLDLTDPGFDHSVLCEFRGRILAGNAEEMLLAKLLERCRTLVGGFTITDQIGHNTCLGRSLHDIIYLRSRFQTIAQCLCDLPKTLLWFRANL